MSGCPYHSSRICHSIPLSSLKKKVLSRRNANIIHQEHKTNEIHRLGVLCWQTGYTPQLPAAVAYHIRTKLTTMIYLATRSGVGKHLLFAPTEFQAALLAINCQTKPSMLPHGTSADKTQGASATPFGTSLRAYCLLPSPIGMSSALQPFHIQPTTFCFIPNITNNKSFPNIPNLVTPQLVGYQQQLQYDQLHP